MASFKKHERLVGKRQIELLFDRSGAVIKAFPLLFIVRPLVFNDQSVAKVLISVSKKKFNRATDRNLIKRRIRSAHIECKEELYSTLSKKGTFGLGVMYMSSTIDSYKSIQSSFKTLLHVLDKSTS